MYKIFFIFFYSTNICFGHTFQYGQFFASFIKEFSMNKVAFVNDDSNANDEAANHYYKPLQPFSLPLQSRPPHVEPGRVDIRLHALYKKLRSLADESTT